jgi:Family of unknown function (DUF6636)
MIRLRSGRAAVAASVPLLLCASLASLGCGDDDVSVTETVETTVTETSAEASGDGSTTGADAPDGAPPAADKVVTEATPFSSPSGNIGCVIEPLFVRCDIAERDWDPPQAPADCELDYGQGLTLEAGATAELVCAGDTTLGVGGPDAALAYGESIAAGLLRCESERSGIRCEDVETGRGFALAREGYEVF